MRHAFALILAAGTSLYAQSAFAVDGTAFAERLKVIYAMQGGGGEISYDSVDSSGEDVTLKGVKFKVPPATEFPLGDLMFGGVAEEAGGFKVAKVTVPDVNTTSDQSSIAMKGFIIENLIVPSEANTTTPFLLYDRAALAELSVGIAGKPAFTMTDYEVLIDAPEPNIKIAFTSVAKSIFIDVSGMATDPKSIEGAKALGLEKIDAKLVMNGSWLAEKGSLDVSEFSFDVPNAGKINLTMAFDGYTKDFMKTLQEVSKATQAAGTDENAQAAQGLAMLGLMQQLAYVSTKLRYDDAGLANRALDLAAKEQNTTRDALIAQGKAVMPLMLGQLQNPEFATAVSTAVSAFLDNPKSLEINATPAAPVPGTMLMATGAGNPMELIKTLNVQVKANE
jgi:hypothetical protein